MAVVAVPQAVVAGAVVAAVGKNMYTNYMRKVALILFLALVYTTSIYAQEIGDTTREILDNVASQQKPQDIDLENEVCQKIFFFEYCPAPKVDYTHADLLPKDRQVEETSLSFWQQISSFFKGLFDKSSDPQTGYGYSYLPKGVNPVSDAVEENVQGINTETAIEETHETVKKSFLPYNYASKLTPAPTSLAQAPPSGVLPEPTNSAGVPPASGNSTVDYAKSLVTTAGKSCGWTTANVRTRTLSCNSCTLPESKDAEPIRCINGKVKPDVYFDLERSANGNSWLQCVGFIIAVEQGMGRELMSRNALDYCLKGTPPGYVTVPKNSIAPGDIVANTVAPYGHIMVILETVKSAKGPGYIIAEANWSISGSMSQGRYIYDSDIGCAFRPKK